MPHQHSHQSPRGLSTRCTRETRDRREWTFALQEACDDVYCSPLDLNAHARLRDLLQRERPPAKNGSSTNDRNPVGAANVTLTREWVRSLRIACDELHDGPEDLDAQNRLLALLSGLAR